MTSQKLWIYVAFLLSVTTVTLAKSTCDNFHGSCFACTANSDCLYCENTGMCVSTQDMSQNTCSKGFRKFCSCSEYNNLGCEKCTEDRRCGWCSSSSSCEERPMLGNHHAKPTCSDSLMTSSQNCPSTNNEDDEYIQWYRKSLQKASPSSSASPSASSSPGLDSNTTAPAKEKEKKVYGMSVPEMIGIGVAIVMGCLLLVVLFLLRTFCCC